MHKSGAQGLCASAVHTKVFATKPTGRTHMHQASGRVVPQLNIVHKPQPARGGFRVHVAVALVGDVCARLLAKQGCQPFQSVCSGFPCARGERLNGCVCRLRVVGVQARLAADTVLREGGRCQPTLLHPQGRFWGALQQPELPGQPQQKQECREHQNAQSHVLANQVVDLRKSRKGVCRKRLHCEFDYRCVSFLCAPLADAVPLVG